MMVIKKTFYVVCCLTGVLGLSACQSKTGCQGQQTKCFSPAAKLFNQTTPVSALNPQFDYIRFKMNGKELMLARGFIDQWPQANTKVYYSADGSVYKWANGRLIAMTLPFLKWRERMVDSINWTAPSPYQFTRQIDTVDKRVGVIQQREWVTRSKPDHHDFVGDDSKLIWKHEYTISSSQSLNDQPTFDSWYAFTPDSPNEPVYGQQCLSKLYCITWQVWTSL